MTDKQKEKITALRHECSGYTAIANSPGISKDTVKSFFRRNGLTGTIAKESQRNPLDAWERVSGRLDTAAYFQ